MPRITTIRLGSQEVQVPLFNLGQLEKIADWLAENREHDSLAAIVRGHRDLLAIAFERSSPKFTDDQLRDLEMDVEELRVAATTILRIAGLAPPEENRSDPEAVAPTGASPNSSIGSSESSQPVADTLLN